MTIQRWFYVRTGLVTDFEAELSSRGITFRSNDKILIGAAMYLYNMFMPDDQFNGIMARFNKSGLVGSNKALNSVYYSARAV